MSESRPHYAYIDDLRIIACFLVLVNHTNSEVFLSRITGDKTWLVSMAYFFLSKSAVTLFVMISGVLFLGRQDSYKKHGRRILRVVFALTIISTFYYGVSTLTTGQPFRITELLRHIYCGTASNALWYLLLYVALLFMMPVLQRLCQSMRQRDYLYFLGTSLVIIGTARMVPMFTQLPRWYGAYYLSFFGAYVGILLLGYYLQTYVRLTKRTAALAFCGALVLPWVQTAVTYGIYRYGWAESPLCLADPSLPLVVLESACVFLSVKYVRESHQGTQRSCGARRIVGICTFGIYLLGDFFIAQYRPIFETLRMAIHPLAAVLLWEILVFISGFVVTYFLRKIPVARKIL